LDLPVGEIGRVRAGVRHESFWLDVPTFSNPSGTATMQGGELDYDETLYNATAVVYLNEEMELFGGFSQGFALSEVGRVLQDQVSYFGGGSVEAIRPEAQTVDNYELGLRGDWGRLRGSVAGFFSESDLGTTFDNATLQVIRQPEEIWGIESGVEYDIHEQWTLGGTATWIESRTDADGDGDLDEELPSTRVPPIKLTGFVEYRPTHWWNNRLQVLFSGDREPDTTVFGSAEVDSFTIVDYFAGFDAGPGELRVGVENLLNEDYYPVAAQAFGMDSTFSQGEGRTVSLSYRIDW
ncbi:MAG: TonB-dependent receptor domain-containing protein, partial [Phycisphaeraceae bacterium]